MDEESQYPLSECHYVVGVLGALAPVDKKYSGQKAAENDGKTVTDCPSG
jgi:hypothetical protein